MSGSAVTPVSISATLTPNPLPPSALSLSPLVAF
jgi:hypothetical protein